MWALIAIGVACLLVLLCCCYCICKRCICKKRKSKDGKKGLKASLKPGLEFALKKENVSPCSNVRAQLECLDFTTVCWQTIFFCLKVLSESMSACTYSNIVFGSTSFEWGLVAFVFSLIIQHILIFFPVVAVKPYSCIMLFDSAGSHSMSFYDIWIFCCMRQVYFILIVWSTWVGVGGFLIHSLWLRDQSYVFEFKSA